MNTQKSILALTAGALLALTSGIAIAQAPAKPAAAPKAAAEKAPKAETKTVDSVTRGTVGSADANMLMLAAKKGSKDPGMMFKLNAQTTKTGDLAPGAAVTVHYKKDGSDMVATSVVATAPKAAAKAAGDAKAKAPAKK